jgi:hypothetical protein
MKAVWEGRTQTLPPPTMSPLPSLSYCTYAPYGTSTKKKETSTSSSNPPQQPVLKEKRRQQIWSVSRTLLLLHKSLLNIPHHVASRWWSTPHGLKPYQPLYSGTQDGFRRRFVLQREKGSATRLEACASPGIQVHTPKPKPNQTKAAMVLLLPPSVPETTSSLSVGRGGHNARDRWQEWAMYAIHV